MTYTDFAAELALAGRVVAIKRLHTCPEGLPTIGGSCTLAALHRVLAGEELVVSPAVVSCKGSSAGMGFTDSIPDVPGGFRYFISCGRGAGFPPGERVKATPEIGEAMLLKQPQGVMDGYRAIRLSPYQEGIDAHTVTFLVNPDQLATLVHIFNFENSDYDTVIAPMVSGCASVFRLPFGELAGRGRAVIGNVDVFSRPHFAEDTFFFTISNAAFVHMLEIAQDSVLASPIWRGIQRRLHQNRDS